MRTNISRASDTLARWSAIAVGFSVPISTALDNVLLLAILVFWLAGAGFREKLALIRANPVAVAALALFGLLGAGCFYGRATATEAIDYLGKYLDLVFIPILISLFREERSRRYAMAGFMLAMAVTLILSYVIRTGLFPQNDLLQGAKDNAYVFKLHITQNVFMAYFAYLLAVKARYSATPRMRLFFALAAALTAYNVLFMVQGRSGYLVLSVLLVYFCFDWLRWRGLIAIGAIGLLILSAGYAGIGPMQERIKLAVTEFAEWRAGHGNQTSTGLRMDYYTNSMAIIREHPLAGVGTGGFEKAYEEKIRNTTMAPSNNPHNEYLLITVQLGVLGLAMLLCLLLVQWRMAGLLPDMLEQSMAKGMLLTMLSGNLINSLLRDHAEGLFFAWASGVLFAGLNVAWRQRGEK